MSVVNGKKEISAEEASERTVETTPYDLNSRDVGQHDAASPKL